jgi:hypothetical protein
MYKNSEYQKLFSLLDITLYDLQEKRKEICGRIFEWACNYYMCDIFKVSTISLHCITLEFN